MMTSDRRVRVPIFVSLLACVSGYRQHSSRIAHSAHLLRQTSEGGTCDFLHSKFPEFGNGFRVGNYTIEKCLGAGGYGEAWLVRHAVEGSKAVGKFLWNNDYSKKDDASLEEECKFARFAKRRSNQFTDCLDTGVVKGIDLPYAVFELAEGREFAEFRDASANESLGIATVFDAMLSLSNLITALLDPYEGIRLAHLDLRLENLFVTTKEASPVVTAIDYGVTNMCCDDAKECLEHGAAGLQSCASQPEWNSQDVLQQESHRWWILDFVMLLLNPPFDRLPAFIKGVSSGEIQGFGERIRPEYQDTLQRPSCKKFLVLLFHKLKLAVSHPPSRGTAMPGLDLAWPPEDSLLALREARQEIGAA